MLKILNHASKNVFCSLPFTKVILNSWGDVSMCCHQATQLGKLTKDVQILDLWNSKIAEDIRKTTEAGVVHRVCQSGGNCPFIVIEKHCCVIETVKRHPLHLEICLPDKHCNVGGETPSDDNPACIMCIRNFRVPKQPDISKFLCHKSLPLMPHLQRLSIMGIAEPFWKNAVFEMLELLEFQKHKHHCEFLTNTNGICISEKVVKHFLEIVEHSNLSWSIDAATAVTHKKIRRLDTFDLVVDNLKRFIRMKDQKHKVTIYNNINMFNVHEMSMMVEMADSIGVDGIYLLPTHNQTGLVQLGELVMCEKNVTTFKKESERARETATKLGVNLFYPTRFDIISPSTNLAVNKSRRQQI